MKNPFTEVKYSLTRKLSLGLISIVLTVGIALATLTYYYNERYVLELSSKVTSSCALDAANMLYNAPFDKFLKGQEKEQYKNHLKSIRNIANTFDLEYLYVYIPDFKNDKLVAIIGVEGDTGNIIKGFELGNSPKNLRLNNQVIKMFKNKEKSLNLQINNEYGHVLSGYSTVFDDKSNPIAIVGADIDFGIMQKELLTDVLKTFLYIFMTLAVIHILTMYYIKKTFIKPIMQLSAEMKNALDDNLDCKPININTNDEFNTIAGLYNTVSMEKKRIGNELLIARTIQLSSLPSVFPPYPEHKEFDIYANMVPAKEVGGDFYDFFFLDDKRFMFLIADVSGKGTPAALFMMTTKTLIKSLALDNVSSKEMINKINKQVCENNKQGFFVTLLAVIVDITTGQATFLNCGHNPPLLKRNNEKYEYYQMDSNLVLGVLDDFDYEIKETVLNNGDTLFLYTDGVTEALNETDELYGEERLATAINSLGTEDTKEIIEKISDDMKSFTCDTEQSDDITMLAFKYNGYNTDTNTLTVEADINKFDIVREWVDDFCQKSNLPKEIMTKMQLISEEIFVNISSYAYPDKNGKVEIKINKNNDEITIQFIDSGKEYNPLEKEDPDITLTAEERNTGGLGIFMVKSMSNSIEYEYKNNKNILTIKI